MHIKEFEKSGLAEIADLQGDPYKELFHSLEAFQAPFLQQIEKASLHNYFSSWPKDTLHWWSRIWEYPYVYYHIVNYLESRPGNKMTIADFGCGITFFPFLLSGHGHKLICIDADQKCIDSLKSYLEIFPNENVLPVQNKGTSIPLENESTDFVYSISVFEHIDNLEPVIRDIHRILKKDGVLIITFDVSHNTSFELQQSRYKEFTDMIMKHFTLIQAYHPSHPAGILTSDNYLFPLYKKGFIREIKTFIRKNLLARNKWQPPVKLSVEGMVLRKKF